MAYAKNLWPEDATHSKILSTATCSFNYSKLTNQTEYEICGIFKIILYENVTYSTNHDWLVDLVFIQYFSKMLTAFYYSLKSLENPK